MQKIFLAIAIMVLSACGSQAFLNETSGLQVVPFTVSYDTTEEGVELTWTVNWDVTSYEVLRGTNQASLQTYVKDLVQTHWVDTETIPGQEYVYALKVYNQKRRQVGEGFAQSGYRSYQDHATMEAPTFLKADDRVLSDRINLEWLGQNKSRFRVYRSANVSGPYTFLEEVGVANYLDTNVEPGQEWYYKVSSVGKDHTSTSRSRAGVVKERFHVGSDKEGQSSLATGVAVVGRTSDAPTGVKGSTTTDEIAIQGAILLTWKYDPLAEFARIYRSTSPDGTPELIAPYSRSTTNIDGVEYSSYIDRSMSVEGAMNTSVSPARFEYPTYYYRVTTIKNGEESAFSAVTPGSAANPKDIIAAPDDFQANLRVATNSSFSPARTFPVLSSSGNYELVLSWEALPSSITDTYGFFIVSSNTVTGKTNILTPVVLSGAAKAYAVTDPSFGDEYRYTIYTINMSKGGIRGAGNGFLYKSSTPPPPTFNSASKLRRTVETNEIITNAPTHTYFKTQFGSDNAIRSVGSVTKVWITTSKVGDVELITTPKRPDTQTSYNFYRRKKGSSESWSLITNIAQEVDPDNPLNVVKQVVYDTNFTAAQYKGSGGKSVETFYPIWEYLVTAVNGSRESALSTKTNEGQAIDPLDILPAPSYLSVPFHYAFATGISAFTGSWTVTPGVPSTTGSVQIVGMGGSTTEYQKMYLTWGGVRADGHIAGQTFDYDVRHAKPGLDYNLPDSWYHHGGINGNTSIKMDNQEDGAYKTGLYTIVDSGIAAAIAGIYSPESAAFAVSATNKKAFGLDGDTIGILFEESPQNPYGTSLPASTGVAGSLLGNNVYPYELRITWNAVEKAAGYQILVATDADIYTGFGKILTNYNRVDGASADPVTTKDRVYHYIPEDEFVLGRKYYFIVATINSNGVMGGTTPMTYTHNRPYKPTLSSLSTNKIFYTTNYTTGLDVGTYVSNTYFEENGFKFEPSNRKLGSVVRMWEVIAEGDRIQLELAYPRFTTLPRGYSLYRSTSTS
ncbi:MAG: hypothetical protein ACRCY4_09145, partial [Brevinema sp.]